MPDPPAVHQGPRPWIDRQSAAVYAALQQERRYTLDEPAGETPADTLDPMSARMMGMIADSMQDLAERG
jgi:hypothetical protein